MTKTLQRPIDKIKKHHAISKTKVKNKLTPLGHTGRKQKFKEIPVFHSQPKPNE